MCDFREKNRIVAMILITFTAIFGCNAMAAQTNPLPKNVWNNIGPPISQKNYKAENELKELLDKKENRKAYSIFILNKIRQNKLSLDDEMRMAIIINRMIQYIPDKAEEEQSRIIKILEEARKHPNLYGAILPIAPPYFLTAIEVFNEESEIIAKAPSPEGGVAEYNVKDMFLRRLREATQQKFGPNYESWKNWWVEKGQLQRYDKKRMKYYSKGLNGVGS